MEIKNVNCKSLEELENAVSQWTVGEPHPMLDIINQVQQESFLEGYNHAIESLQEQLEPSSPKAFIQKCHVKDNPIRNFLQDLFSQAQWRCFYPDILIQIYPKWLKEHGIKETTAVGKKDFLKAVRNSIDPLIDGWKYIDYPYRISNRMDGSEPLLAKYGIRKDKKLEKTRGLFKIN